MNREEFEKLREKRLSRKMTFELVVYGICIVCGIFTLSYLLIGNKTSTQKPEISPDGAGFTVQKVRAEPQKEAVFTQQVSMLKFKGDKSSKIYYSEGCMGFYDVETKNAVWFQTKDEAEAKGYRLSSYCNQPLK